MEQDDEEFEKLLGEIPRATSEKEIPRANSAPPHLEEVAGPQEVDGSSSSAKEEALKPFTDIRCDELYEDFYRSYSGAKKLPPPMENRAIYNDLAVVSPKSASNQLSPFYSGLALDSPRTSFRRQLETQHKQSQQQPPPPQQQRQEQEEEQVQQSPGSELVDRHSQSSSQQLLPDDRAMSSAFANLNFDDDTVGGTQGHEENGSGIGGHSNSGSPEFGFASQAPLNSRVSSSFSSLNLFPHNAVASREPLSNGFRNGLDGLASVPVAENVMLQGSPGMRPYSYGRSPQRIPDVGFLPHNQLMQQQSVQQQHQSVQQQHQRRQNLAVYPAAMAAAAAAMEAGHNHGNGIAPVNDILSSSRGQQVQNPVRTEMTSFIQAQQRMHQAAAASRAQQEIEEERLRYRQRMQQQLVLRQQQLRQQHARFYASLQSQPVGVESPYARVHHPLNQIGHQPALNPGYPMNFLQQQMPPKQRQQGGLTSDEGWKQQQAQGPVATSISELDRVSQPSNICRYHAQGFCSRGEVCPFLHIESQTGRMPQSNPSSLSRVVTVSPGMATRPGKILIRKSPPSGQGNGQSTLISSVGRRKDALANGHSNGHVHSNGNSQTRSGNFHADDKDSQTSENFDLEAPRSTNVPHHLLQQQQPKYTTLEEVEGRIYSIAKDQHGCRFLQRKFEEGAAVDVQKIFLEIIDHIIELMTDPFGNYLVQKLLEVCDEPQRMEILQRVTGKGQLVTISLNMHGTRAVQKLIETLKPPEQVSMLISSLKQGVVTLIKDLNGNHVVQRCLQCLTNEDNQFIFDAAATHCVEIATHRHGCCVLQRCVDYASGAQRRRLVAVIAANALVLSQDPFGNYVVQYVLDLGMPWATSEVIAQLEGSYAYLAMQKFSSNVVEKSLKLSGEDSKAIIIHELIASSRLGQLLQDPYANYVVQSALTVSKGALHTELVEAIRPHLSALRSSPYGKRILSRTNIKK